MGTELGEKIKRLRKERGWTQNELTLRSGVDRTSIASIETGKSKNPSAENFLKLARAFGIRPEELYEAAGYIKEPKTTYDFEETPKRLLDNIKVSVHRLEKMLKENEEK